MLLRKWEFKSSSDRFSPFFESSGPKQKGHNPYPLGHNVPPPAHIWVESYLKIVATTSTITVPSLMLLPQSAQFSYFFFTPYDWTNYCAFHKQANFEVQKPTDISVFRCRQS